ncbi:MAG: Glycosyltransferase involved in cell wall bisynthesis [Candidatus Electronema aureum]|uniref:Glycosyltransferase involved in cell wall bisynthesis n=1 Tax=Candidatus Electronema aureum TaxID=2005002 RepID=A0A521FZV0_9BACT|nr:MAG: Glycosyltransferase involved in cell wall bisynthesis [Candidatus Electronema aureum]
MPMKTKKVIFICGITPYSLYGVEHNFSMSPPQYAAERFQQAFISGLKAVLESDILIVTAPFFGSWPINHKLSYIKKKIQDFPLKIKGISYLNFPLIKNINKFINIRKTLNKELVENHDEYILISYSLNVAYVASSVFCGYKNKKIKRCVIITDLPDFPGDCNYFYKFYISFFEKKIIKFLLKKMDFFVILTEQMQSILDICKNKCIVIEGIYQHREASTEQVHLYFPENSSCYFDSKKILMYCGTVDERYGVKKLVDDFNEIHDSEIELWICGGGASVNYIKSMCNFNSKIKYLGILSMDNILVLQKKVDLLINPRSNVGEFNKYSFPSKTMEYLASGTPTLMYRLDGIPEEYYRYCYTVNTACGETIKNAIVRVFNIPCSERKALALSAREFILTKKNALKQVERFFEFIS